MNVYAKQIHRYRKQTCGCQRGEMEHIRNKGLTEANYFV